MNRSILSFFALSSYRPNGNHFFMADYDGRYVMPKRNEFLYQTSLHNYHIIDFTDDLTIHQLIFKLRLTGADTGFICWVEKNGFAQLRVSEDFKIVKEGVFPLYPLKFLEVTFVNVTIKPA